MPEECSSFWATAATCLLRGVRLGDGWGEKTRQADAQSCQGRGREGRSCAWGRPQCGFKARGIFKNANPQWCRFSYCKCIYTSKAWVLESHFQTESLKVSFMLLFFFNQSKQEPSHSCFFFFPLLFDPPRDVFLTFLGTDKASRKKQLFLQ